MTVNYNFVPQFKAEEARFKSDVVSYAGKLLEILGAPTVVLTLDSDNRPLLFTSEQRLVNPLDVTLDEY